MENNQEQANRQILTKEEIFGKILDKMYTTYKKKNADYTSGKKSSFERSFERFGITSLAVRLNDKVDRICAYAEKGEYLVEDENVFETLLDNAVYSVLGMVEIEYNRLVKEG